MSTTSVPPIETDNDLRGSTVSVSVMSQDERKAVLGRFDLPDSSSTLVRSTAVQSSEIVGTDG